MRFLWYLIKGGDSHRWLHLFGALIFIISFNKIISTTAAEFKNRGKTIEKKYPFFPLRRIDPRRNAPTYSAVPLPENERGNWFSLSSKKEVPPLIDVCLLRCIRIHRFAGISIPRARPSPGKHKSRAPPWKRHSQPVIVLARAACINRTFNFFNGILTWTSLFGRESRHRRGARTEWSRSRACERARHGASFTGQNMPFGSMN